MSEDRERPTDDAPEPADNICDECGSTGEVNGRVCRSCQGKGYVNP